MDFNNSKGITLIENLVTIILVSALLVGILGAFFVSKSGTARARHRVAAANLIREYVERELEAGYDGGTGDEGDYYVTVTSASGNAVVIDQNDPDNPDDNLNGTIVPDPYYPYNVEDSGGVPLTSSGVPYKVVGFLVSWQEPGTGQVCTERAVTYVSYHSST
jgi:type II secretory pathway pseudopilin PulG